MTRKIKLFKEWKKGWEIIIFHICIINDNHIVWFLRYGAQQTFLSFSVIFCHFEKMKISPGYHHFTQLYQKSWSYATLSWDLTCDGCNFYFSFWATFCPFTPLTTQKVNILKKWKKNKMPGDIIILQTCTKNYDYLMYGAWDMVHDGRSDSQTEKVTYRGGCST